MKTEILNISYFCKDYDSHKENTLELLDKNKRLIVAQE